MQEVSGSIPLSSTKSSSIFHFKASVSIKRFSTFPTLWLFPLWSIDAVFAQLDHSAQSHDFALTRQLTIFAAWAR
jgi:hypothetical protein